MAVLTRESMGHAPWGHRHGFKGPRLSNMPKAALGNWWQGGFKPKHLWEPLEPTSVQTQGSFKPSWGARVFASSHGGAVTTSAPSPGKAEGREKGCQLGRVLPKGWEGKEALTAHFRGFFAH